MEFECKRNCPVDTNPPPCCVACWRARKDFVNDTNRHLWSEERGFWKEDGCKLSREEMPIECKAYDCTKNKWLVEIVWTGSGWKVVHAMELEKGQGIFIGKKAEEDGNRS